MQNVQMRLAGKAMGDSMGSSKQLVKDPGDVLAKLLHA